MENTSTSPGSTGATASGAGAGDWGDGGGGAPKKRRVPKWLWWGCGGGCLLMVLAVVAVVIFATRIYREGVDPEKQWPRLGEVLAFEERPAGLELKFGARVMGSEQYHLVDPAKGLQATLIEYPAGASGEHGKLFDAEFQPPLGFGRPIEPEPGELTVQGKAVRCLRYARLDPVPPAESSGPGIRIDLTGERPRPRTIELRSLNGQRVEDADVEAFLAPFQVWKEP
jgi:hypothetical protein